MQADAGGRSLGAIAWKRRPAREQAPQAGDSFHEWLTPAGAVWTEFFRNDGGYLLRFPGKADFRVSPDGLEVESWPVPGCAAATLVHLYQNQVLPLALSRQGQLVLHASAVNIGGNAVAFLGATGRGKSTLAASFAAAGCELLTDDGLHVEMRAGAPVALPSEPSVRLWADSRDALGGTQLQAGEALDYTSKARIIGGGGLAFAGHAAPLSLLILLGQPVPQGTELTPLKPADAMMAMVENSFVLDVTEKSMLARHFEQIASLAALPIHLRLDYPRSYEELPAVRAAVIAHVRRLA